MEVNIGVPANSRVRMVGITNSGFWKQEIDIQPFGEKSITWSGTGSQVNQVVGTYVTEPSREANSINVAMYFNDGVNGNKPSGMTVAKFDAPGLEGYVVGGQDEGGRPAGPAFLNAIVLIYWAKGY